MRTLRPHLAAACATALAVTAACTPVSAQQRSGQQDPRETPSYVIEEGGGAIAQFREAHGDFVARAVWVPPIIVRGTWMPSQQLGGEPGHFDMWELDLDATIPLPISRDSFVIFGLEAGMRPIHFTNVQTVADDTLYKIGPRLGFGHFFNEDLTVQAYWQPSIYSDLGGQLEPQDWRPEYGTALAVYRQSDDLFWKLGFRVTDAVDSGVIPLGGVMWHFGEQWMLDVLAPRHAQVRYVADDKWTLSGGFVIRADEWHIRGPASIGKPEHDVHTQEVMVQVASQYSLTDNLSSQLAVGMVFAGEWDWGYGNGQPKYDGSLDPGLVLEWSLGWRF